MRLCNIPPARCRHRYSAPCCRDCPETNCESRCLNDPDRCGCWSDKPPGNNVMGEREPRFDRDEILRLRRKGLSRKSIAEHMGCCRSTVTNALREMGVAGYDKS